MSKITVIGAGNVGATIANDLMIQGIASEIVLIDINRPKAFGEALDIYQGVPYCAPAIVRSGDYPAAADSDIVVITSGMPRKAGQSRLELAQVNVNIMKDIASKIVPVAPNALYVIVSNPVDVLTYAAIKMSGLPEGHVIGSGTVLDTGRLQQMLGAHVEVDPRDVQAYVMGEHGDSEFVAWSSAQVAGVPLNTFCELHGHLEHEAAEKRIAEDVKNSAYTIIEKKHATYYGVAMAVKRICTAVMRDEQTVLPVSSLMVGEYGLSDLAISMPTVVGRDGVVCRVPVPLNDDEQHELTVSAKALKDIIDSVDFSC